MLIVVEFAAKQALGTSASTTHILQTPNLATRLRPEDKKWFQPFFVKHLDVHVFDARKGYVALDQMDGLLLTGGSDAR